MVEIVLGRLGLLGKPREQTGLREQVGPQEQARPREWVARRVAHVGARLGLGLETRWAWSDMAWVMALVP